LRLFLLFVLALSVLNSSGSFADGLKIRGTGPLKTAKDFWFSPEVQTAIEKNVFGIDVARKNEWRFNHLLRTLRPTGLPLGFLSFSSQNVDFISLDSMGSASIVYDIRYRLNALLLPKAITYPDGSLLPFQKFDAALLAQLYRVMFYITAHENPLVLLPALEVVNYRIRKLSPGSQLTDEDYADISEELLARDVECIVNDFVLAYRILERHKNSGEGMSRALIDRIREKIYHPQVIYAEASITSKDGKTQVGRMYFRGSLQKLVFKNIFEGKLTGNVEHDFAGILN